MSEKKSSAVLTKWKHSKEYFQSLSARYRRLYVLVDALVGSSCYCHAPQHYYVNCSLCTGHSDGWVTQINNESPSSGNRLVFLQVSFLSMFPSNLLTHCWWGPGYFVSSPNLEDLSHLLLSPSLRPIGLSEIPKYGELFEALNLNVNLLKCRDT